MPLFIVRNDITKMRVDAIVNAANSSLLGGGGVDGAIHRAAGRGLFAECLKLGGCKTGEAKATGAYRLPAKYVIHTVGPIWRGGTHREPELLASCYKNSLRIAEELGCGSIAFPLISAGVYGYPKEQALRVALDEAERHLENSDITIYIVLFDKADFGLAGDLSRSVEEFIDDNYVETHSLPQSALYARHDAALNKKTEAYGGAVLSQAPMTDDAFADADYAEESCARPSSNVLWPRPKQPKQSAAKAEEPGSGDLISRLNTLDESFSQMLLRKIDEKGITDAQCYKRANIDRKLFSKIRGDVHYRPSKSTALAFAIALELGLDETCELLMKAGYAISHSCKFDVIIEYFIVNGNYDIYRINETLFDHDQPLLGNAG